MDISIIIDKSTFQSLNYDELYRLSCYYKHIITPVLTMEILGDLKKETKEGQAPSIERVKDFAKKLFPLVTIVNQHYKELVYQDLIGRRVSMDGRPNVRMSKAVTSSSGQKGYIVEETVEERCIYKWKEGNFNDVDRELSAIWRIKTTNDEVLKKLKEVIKTKLPQNIKDFNELDRIVTENLSQISTQQTFLLALMQNYDIDPRTAITIFENWQKAGKPLLSTFAPYAFHCLRVDMLFLYGLASNLISTRPTNRVDLEYLYYQPFGNIFTSNDKLHKNLAPLLLRPYQKFIIGNILKEDLKEIVKYLNNLDTDEVKQFKNEPPIIKDSMTFRIWEEFYDYPNSGKVNYNITDAEKEMIKRKLQEFEKAMENDDIGNLSQNETEFVVHQSYLSKNDLCFCGSGKIVIDCCIPEKEFDRIALQEMEKQRQKNRN